MTRAASDSLADGLQKIDKILADAQLQARPSETAEVGPCLKHALCSCVMQRSAEELLCPSLDHLTLQPAVASDAVMTSDFNGGPDWRCYAAGNGEVADGEERSDRGAWHAGW